jgi:hypothetical protein
MVTVFAPEFAQVNAFGDTEKLAIPHASEEPLFTANESIATLPVWSKSMDIFLEIARGAIVSATVTTEVQVVVFPETSVTVMVTVFVPILAQVKECGLTEKVAMAQLSVDPLLTANESIVTVPALSNCIVIFLQVAIGAIVSETVTVETHCDEFPDASVTVKVTLFAPIFEQINESGLTTNEAIPQSSVDKLSTSVPMIVT